MAILEAPTPVGLYTEQLFTDTHVTRTTKQAFPSQVATRLANDLVRYASMFEDEALAIPRLTEVHLEDAAEGQRLVHTMERCMGPNLTVLQNEHGNTAVYSLLSDFTEMTMADGTLRVPFDAQAANFHTSNNGIPTLVDLAPPMPRHRDGSFPTKNLPHGQAFVRRSILPYLNGTLEGASLRLLSTAAIGRFSVRMQLEQNFKKTDNWCYDAIPEKMPGRIKDRIRRAMRTRFVAQWALAYTSGGVKRFRDKIGMPSYEEGEHNVSLVMSSLFK